jgi:hypothetical protein
MNRLVGRDGIALSAKLFKCDDIACPQALSPGGGASIRSIRERSTHELITISIYNALLHLTVRHTSFTTLRPSCSQARVHSSISTAISSPLAHEANILTRHRATDRAGACHRSADILIPRDPRVQTQN